MRGVGCEFVLGGTWLMKVRGTPQQARSKRMAQDKMTEVLIPHALSPFSSTQSILESAQCPASSKLRIA